MDDDTVLWRLKRLYWILFCGASKGVTKRRTGNPITDALSRWLYEGVRWDDRLETRWWYPDKPYQTLNGRVRSHGEKQIANTLIRANISFQYERPITLGGCTVHPDFYLNDYGVYIEFCGPVADGTYMLTLGKKKRLYDQFQVPVIYLYPPELKLLPDVIWQRFHEVTGKQITTVG